MDEETAKEVHYIHEAFSGQRAPDIGLVGAGLAEISQIWYEAALIELSHSKFLSKPRLSTVQTLAILNLLHRNFGESHREYFLLGLAINTARILGLDHLKKESVDFDGATTYLGGNAGGRSDRELGRRLWWTLVICDW
jgi:hypothetical protein